MHNHTPTQMPVKFVIKECLGGATPVTVRARLLAKGTVVSNANALVVLPCETKSALGALGEKGWSLEQLGMVTLPMVLKWRATEMAKYPTALPGVAYHSAVTVIKALLPALIAANSNQ
jgi:hypothetical protein